jgi:HD-like signal output (HDOD) protein
MKSILFVDDEPKVLGALRRMLRNLRREWRMEFVESGPQALECLAAAPFDVLVTDMRMPGMDGSQLLREAMERYPATVRIILSGQCEQESVLKCVGPAHQFLTKPCDSETLKSTIGRACRLRDHLPNEWTKQVVSSIRSVPSRPSVHAELVAKLGSPAGSIERVGEIMARDVGMTAKILQLVSSSFFGTPRRVSDVAHAVSLLGLDTVSALVRSTDVFYPSDGDDSWEHIGEMLSDHSLAVARAARRIAEGETDDVTLIGDTYLSGLLHDVGVLVFAKDSPEHYIETLALARLDQTTLRKAEKRTFSTTRDDVGAYLMGLWGLPDPIVKAIAYHLSPGRSPDQTFGPLTAVHVANAVVEKESAEIFGVAGPIDMDYLKTIGCADRLDTWREICRAAVSEGVLQ